MDWDLSCENCGVHYTLSPGNSLDGAVTNGMACPECGGKRFLRNQPSPTLSDGTARDMVDSDSQIDQGGNPLGEGTIMGDDGERPFGKRDNFMHSHEQYPGDWNEASDIERLQALYHHALEVEGDPDKAREIFNHIQNLQNQEALRSEHAEPYNSPVNYDDFLPPEQRGHPDPEQDAQPGDLTLPPHWGHKSVAMDRSLDMDPYEMDGLFDLPNDYRSLPYRQAGVHEAGGLWNSIKSIAPAVGEAGLAALAPVDQEVPGLDVASDAAVADEVGSLAGGAAEEAGQSMVQKGLDMAKQKGISTLKNQAMNQVKQRLLPSGGIGGLMKGALGVGAGGAAGAAAGGTGAGAGGAAGVPTQPGWQTTQPGQWYGSADIPMLLLADLETSDSVKSLGEQNGDDPQKVDTKEFNDQDKSPSNHKNPNNEDSGSSGEDGAREKDEGYGFGPNSPGIDRAMMMLPLLIHYYQSEESGENDPLIKGLHDMLEQENPGYLQQTHPDGDSVVQEIIKLHKPHPGEEAQHAQHQAGFANPFDPQQATDPGPQINQPVTRQMGTPQIGSRCPQCNGVTNPDGSCPQCGQSAQQPGMVSMPNRVGNTVGPQTPEARAVLEQYLLDHGREQDIPNVELHPEMFAKEWAEITRKPNAPPMPDPSQVTPLVPQPSNPGAMPVPDPSAAAGPGGAAPMQPMSSSRQSAPYGRDTEWPRELPPPHNQEGFHYLEPGEAATGDSLALGRCPRCGEQSLTPFNGLCQKCGFAMPKDSQDVALPQINPEGAYTLQPGEMDEGTLPRHWGAVEALVWPIDQLHVADANARVPRCPRCNSGSTTLVEGADADLDTARGRCHSCENIWDLKPPTTDKFAADSVAPRCPECHSGTTTTRAGQEGISFECNSCHHIWERSDVDTIKYKGGSVQSSIQIEGLVDVPNPNLNRDDSAMAWKDTTGQDLQEGQEYQITSAAFNAPTYATVLKVHPNHLDMKVSGGVAALLNPDENAPDFQIKRKEAQIDDYEFTPTNNPQSDMDDRNNEPPPGSTTPGFEQVPPSGMTTDEMSSSFPNTTVSSVEEEDEDEEEDDHCRKCGSTMLDHTMRDEYTTFHSCVPCGHGWETRDDFQGREAGVDLGWLLSGDDGGPDDFWAGMERANAMREAGTESRNLSDIVSRDERYQAIHERLRANAMSREAGKHFTPSEKRALINERGKARNLEDLDLSNTHYDIREDFTGKANGMNVREDDLFLGL